MDLALSEDQELLIDSARALLDKHSTTEQVRAAEPLGFDPALWTTVQELGPVHMAVPESEGGWGASMLDLVLLAECLGRSCASAPVLECQVAARLLARLHSPALTPLLDDGQIATLALHPPRASQVSLVPAGAVADLVVLRSADAVLAVPNRPTPPAVPNHANLPLADVPVVGAQELARGPDAVAAFETSIDEWLLLTASALVGLSTAALQLAVEYARERRAFGSPIGAFQGIAHRLADAATLLDGARLLVRDAACSVDDAHPEAAQRQCMAFAFASDAARQITYWAVHTLGGYGVMLEYDAQLYFRRARGWAGVFGGSEDAYRRVAHHRYHRHEAAS